MKTAGLRRQRLKEITVEVLDAATGDPAGTGVLVSAAGFAVTCSHVVEACGVDPRRVRGGDVLVRLPKTSLHDAVGRHAQVVWFPPDHEDDLVILELAGGPVPPERVGVCGPAGDAEEVAFRSFGFRQRGEYRGLMARGFIETHVDSERHFLQQPLQLRSPDLDSGMSGAAVLDIERNLVVGFVFQVWDYPSQKDRDLAFAVDAGLLAHSPLRESIVATALPLEVTAQPVVHPAITLPEAPDRGLGEPRVRALPPPDHLGTFVGRKDLLSRLHSAWANPEIKIVGITGIAGEGKTSLVRQWLHESGAEEPVGSGKPPFWWSFDPQKAEEDEFLGALISHLSGLDGPALPSAAAKANLAAALLPGVSRTAIVLDDLSVYQSDAGELYGCFSSGAIKDFLTYACSAEHRSLLILTSEFAFPELEPMRGFEQIQLSPLSAEDGTDLLRANGISGEEAVLEQLVADWGGNPQALTAVAIYLKTRCNGIARRTVDPLKLAEGVSFRGRMQAVENAIQERRTPAEQAALGVLALARSAISESVLLGILHHLWVAGLGPQPPPTLDGLTASKAIRTSSIGLAPHPVLRNLYRTRLRVADPRFLSACHRLLANHYYAARSGLS
jgi:Trypsin-like peptidase domain